MQNELLNWLLSHYGQEQMRPGLERIRSALSSIFPKFSSTKIVIIAGTNGKGETALRLSKLLKKQRHFVWTSPHIERLTERFRTEDGEISPIELKKLIQECHEIVLKEKIELSFYEFLFFVFCTWASKSSPEFLLLEVGLGGRLDAVNVFDADLVLLPSISRDHQEILGSRYESILLEKLGTLRKKSLLIHFLHSQYLVEKTDAYCENLKCRTLALKKLVPLPVYEFSQRNNLLATAAFCHLTGQEFSPASESKDLVPLEHRGEVVTFGCQWLFFGSHNVDGVRKLIQFLHSGTYNFPRPPYDFIIVAFSRRNLRDTKVMMKMFKQAGMGRVIVTSFDHPKAEKAHVMEALSLEEGLEFVQDIDSFIQKTKSSQRLLVSGSYYFLGHLKSLLRSKFSSTHPR